MKNLKHDYRKKTIWKLEDPGMEPWPGEKPKRKSRRRSSLKIRLILALLVVLVVGGIWLHRHSRQQTVITTPDTATSQTITIPLPISGS